MMCGLPYHMQRPREGDDSIGEPSRFAIFILYTTALALVVSVLEMNRGFRVKGYTVYSIH